MNTSFLGQVRIASSLRRCKYSNVSVDSIRCNLSHIATICEFCDAKQTCRFVTRLWAAKILQVDCSSYSTQIADCVVPPIAINMVGVVLRKNPMNIKPRQSVGKIAFAVNANMQVSVLANTTSNLTGQDSAASNATCENSGFRIVRKKLVEPRLCKHVAPHQSERHPKSCSKRWMKPPVPRRVSCQSILQ